MRTASIIIGLALLTAPPATAWEQYVTPGGAMSGTSSAFMRAYGSAQPPSGFVRFCETNRSECLVRGNAAARVHLTPDRYGELESVNRSVNAALEPVHDQDAYGIDEYWTLPVSRGDCEDYALLKRKMLIDRGWPSSALLLTVVRDNLDEGHAVLTVRSMQGDFILDNKVNLIRAWSETDYVFVMRQSSINPLVWVSLDHADARAPASLAGVPSDR